jgi:hypothetical protein
VTHLVVYGASYTEASALLADANRWAAVRVDALSTALARSGAMAGDSSFADEFAAAYDEAATEALAAFDDVVGALASLCRITYSSWENHARAEDSSIAGSNVISSDPQPLHEVLYDSESPAPPSSLGGDASFVPGWANVILDHVEGFVWPDADVDRLRSTADAWRAAADDLSAAASYVDRAAPKLGELRSPEILLAVGVLDDAARGIRDLAYVCTELGTVCDDYASAVEEQRELILDLVSDLIRDAVLIAAAGFVLGLVTGGSTNAVAAWINGGKLAAHVPRFRAFVETLRLYAAGAASALRTTSTTVARVRAELARFLRARRLEMGDRGSINLSKPLTWLGRHEGGPMKAHTLAKHVGKSNRYLLRRLANEPAKTRVSTFTNERIAERCVRSVLKDHADAIKSWLASPSNASKRLESVMPEDVGRIMYRGGPVVPGRGVRVVLVKDASMPGGYRILTSMVQ